MTKTFSYEMTILEHHLDTFGHVNNAVYLELFEEARWDLITKGGYGWREIQKSKEGPIILEVSVKFLKELKCRQKIRIETTCTDYSRAVAELEQKIMNDSEEECATAKFKFALFDMEKRKIIRPTPAWLEALGIPTNA